MGVQVPLSHYKNGSTSHNKPGPAVVRPRPVSSAQPTFDVSMSTHTPALGDLITDGDRRRDAVHVAVAPVTAAERLAPGQHVGFVRAGDMESVGPSDDPIGVVDPFLRTDGRPGERFWLFVYPNTVASLRHVWTHPAFAPRVPTGAARSAREN